MIKFKNFPIFYTSVDIDQFAIIFVLNWQNLITSFLITCLQNMKFFWLAYILYILQKTDVFERN